MIRWLKENVHEKGNFYKINEILEKITGEKLNLNPMKIIFLIDI